MSTNSKIEWLKNEDGAQGATWNPITGCSKISEGCRSCYAERMAHRLAGRYGYPEAPNQFRPTFHPDKLSLPASWSKPKRVFVCSMGDIFHDDVEWNWIFDVFQMAGQLGRHRFMFLTKRPQRALELLNGSIGFQLQRQSWCKKWPLENVWIGVTAENQKQADERIPILLTIPAAVRFVSVEPMLGPTQLDFIQVQDDEVGASAVWPLSGRRTDMGRPCKPTGKLDWVICGAETGPGKRPMDLDWVRSLRDQCVTAGVPFFFKKDSSGNHELDGKIWEQMPK